MSRRFWMVILGIGAVLGFAAGVRSLMWHHAGHGGWYGPGGHRAQFEARVADICTRSAERVFRERAPGEAKPAPGP